MRLHILFPLFAALIAGIPLTHTRLSAYASQREPRAIGFTLIPGHG